MSKKSKKNAKDKRRKERAQRKHQKKSLYESFRNSDNSKRRRIKQKKKKRSAGKHVHPVNCGNIACKKCFADFWKRFNANTRPSRSVLARQSQ